jgi:hypothetical protein
MTEKRERTKGKEIPGEGRKERSSRRKRVEMIKMKVKLDGKSDRKTGKQSPKRQYFWKVGGLQHGTS